MEAAVILTLQFCWGTALTSDKNDGSVMSKLASDFLMFALFVALSLLF